jgi:HK97 family phage major capsid protein/HK97 family phage prohead protease
MNRAYSLLSVKSVDDDQRIITGVATTPSVDRMGDVIDSLGVRFTNPLALLHQHDSDRPVGTVKFNKPTKEGVTFEAKLPKIAEPGPLKDRVDTAWGEVKAGLIRAVSIGFRALEYSFIENGGIHFKEIEVYELSLVSVPAQADAKIETIKSIDAPQLAATGKQPRDSDRPTPPAPGKKSTKFIQAKEAKTVTKRTIAEQKTALEASRQSKSARMTEIMDVANEKGETLDEAGKQEYDDLKVDVKNIDDHLVRLGELEALNVQRAVPVIGGTQDDATRSRGTDVTRVQVMPKKLPPGIGFTRFVIAQCRAKGNIMQALEIAKANEQWRTESPEVELALKAAVTPGTTTDTTWAAPLVNYTILTEEFINFLRPLTIIGRIAGLRRVPFNIKIGRQTGGASVNWVGQTAPKPLTSQAFDSITLDLAKIAGIIVLSDELVKISNPSAEMLVRDDLAAAVVQFMDSQFVDPTKAAVSTVSPASITNGVTPTIATGTTGAALRADLKTLMGTFLAANMQIGGGMVFIMTQQTALAISLMTNSLGNREFPGISQDGGTLLGIPVVTSENVPATGGSPSDGYPIILASASDILLADDGQVTIDASREASLQMETAPDSPATASTTFVSMFQQNMIAIRAERYINWAKRRSGAVQYISNAKYFE